MTTSEPWRIMGHVDSSAHTQDVHTKRKGGSALRDKALWVTGLISEVNAYSILTIHVTPPTRMISLISEDLTPASASAFLHGSTVRWTRGEASDSNCECSSFWLMRCGPLRPDKMNGKLISVWEVEERGFFG